MKLCAGCITNESMERDAALNVRLPAEVKTALRRAAEDDHGRSLSGMVVRICQEWLAEAGYLKSPTRSGATSSRRRK